MTTQLNAVVSFPIYYQNALQRIVVVFPIQYISLFTYLLWVRGIVVLNVECEFRGGSSNPSECHNHVMLTLGKSTLP